MDDEGRPYFIDFATAIVARPGLAGLVSRFVFRRFAAIDRWTLVRIKSDFYPEALTSEERHLLEHPPWHLRVGRCLKKNVYRLRKPHHRRELLSRLRRRF
jgi:hypothetical protein